MLEALGETRAILVFGPWEAKEEFERVLSRGAEGAECTVWVEPGDTLTEPSIVARIRAFFLEARPRGRSRVGEPG